MDSPGVVLLADLEITGVTGYVLVLLISAIQLPKKIDQAVVWTYGLEALPLWISIHIIT
jgi:hypothetical protein